MNANTYFVAIDLGSSTVRGMLARKAGRGQLEILGVEEMPSAGIEKGVVVGVSDVAHTLKSIILKLQNRLPQNVKIVSVDVGINACDLKSKRIRESYEFEQRELDDIVLEELETQVSNKFDGSVEQVFAVVRQEFELDGIKTADVEGRFCSKCTANFLLLTGKREISNKIEEVVENVKIVDLGHLPLLPQRLGDLLATADEKAQGCAVINFGAQTTSVVIYADGFLRHLAVLPFGGLDLTGDLSKTLSLHLNDAETLKLKHTAALLAGIDETERNMNVDLGNGKTETTEQIVSITQARIDEIADIICLEIFNAGYWGKLDAGLIITGNASRLRAMDALLKLKTGMAVRKGSMEKYLVPQSVETKYDRPEYHNLLAILDCATESNTKTETPPPPPPVQETAEKQAAEDPKPQKTKKGKDKSESGKGKGLFDDIISSFMGRSEFDK